MDSKDRLQVTAFHSIYRQLRRTENDKHFGLKRKSREEDFVEAIVLTSDDAFKDADPALVSRWEIEFDEGIQKCNARSAPQTTRQEKDTTRIPARSMEIRLPAGPCNPV